MRSAIDKIAETKAKTPTHYHVSLREYFEIREASQDITELVTNAFYFGFMKGENSERRKKQKQRRGDKKITALSSY